MAKPRYSDRMLRDRVNTSHKFDGFYSTPEIFTEWLISRERFIGNILEPACGDGRMSRVLERISCRVVSRDLVDRGHGAAGHNFLTSRARWDNIVTNPPYDQDEAFVRHALGHARNKVAMILRLNFLEGAARARTIYARYPPTRLHFVARRTSMMPAILRANGKMKATNSISYCWFVWDNVDTRRDHTWLL